jgi:hypothetical protein
VTTTDLFADLKCRGITLCLEGEGIRVRSANRLTAELRRQLLARKPELLALLRSAAATVVDDEIVPIRGPIAVALAELPAALLETWEERAAIREYDGGLHRARAEVLALEDVRRQMSGRDLGAKGKFAAGDDDLTTCG